ncbi:membrane protein required for colicin V production [Poseidonocella pacifica]|uniref:Membrane protein required for colicin V production n=1 Tax=Poseidonocella pacifica TaxID=871651 RepID=A0A1I0V5R1_9RHOB|nr:CvpA family protein [Poseidonocella pacifica]SFA71684.1 membrane protein required for colicin V production [Poseidonocella pacifica]
MDGFTIIDGIVAVVIVLSALLAYSRGLVREVMAILGWIGAAIVAFLFADQVQPLVKEIPYIGDFLSDSCELSVLLAFAIVFTIALVIFSFFTPLLSSMVQGSALGRIDQGFGFLFGVVRGILLVAVGFFVYGTVVTTQDVDMVENSRSAAVFARFTDRIEERNPEQALGWITQQYEQLVGVCETPT